jgi:hypothetical protein
MVRIAAVKIFGLALIGLVALLSTYWPNNFDRIHIAIIFMTFIAGIAAGVALEKREVE